MTTSVKDGKWVRSPDYRRHLNQGSILFVSRSKRDIKTDDVHRFCNLIEEIAVPFVLKENASSPGAEKRLLSQLAEKGAHRGMEYCGGKY
jgi:hypothetical protein